MTERDSINTIKDIPFFGSARAHMDMAEELQSEAMRVLISGQSLQGVDIARLEQRVADMVDRDQSIAVGSATDGLFFALRALGIGPGDSVLVPALSFIASASCIIRSGAKPIFVDVDATGQIDLTVAETQITSNTKAILAVHLYGNMLDPIKLLDFATAHELLIVEDAAQAFGASYAGRPAGSLGNASVFSFDPTKVIGAPGSGGLVMVDDDLGARIKALRYHGKTSKGFASLGFNSQMSTLVAAILNLKLDRNVAWTVERQRIATVFDKSFEALPVTLTHSPESVNNVRHKYTILTEQRDGLSQYLAETGIPTRSHYGRILPDEPMFMSSANQDFPSARQIAETTLSLPIHAYLTNEEVNRIVSAVTHFFE